MFSNNFNISFFIIFPNIRRKFFTIKNMSICTLYKKTFFGFFKTNSFFKFNRMNSFINFSLNNLNIKEERKSTKEEKENKNFRINK